MRATPTTFEVTDTVGTSGTTRVSLDTSVTEFASWYHQGADGHGVTETLGRVLHGLQTGERDQEGEDYLGLRVTPADSTSTA